MQNSLSRSIRFMPFAVEGAGTPDAKGIAPGVGQDGPDPDWHPM
jgi:hypothetical protein